MNGFGGLGADVPARQGTVFSVLGRQSRLVAKLVEMAPKCGDGGSLLAQAVGGAATVL